MRLLPIFFLLGAMLAGPAAAQDLAPGKSLEPEVTIAPPPGSEVEEYRIRGRLYMVKVTPPKPLPPYYLVDTDGDGRFETRRSTLDENFVIPRWVIFEF